MINSELLLLDNKLEGPIDSQKVQEMITEMREIAFKYDFGIKAYKGVDQLDAVIYLVNA